ncbi:MAG: DUF2007 domain-containing protein [Geminicoccaceae bacterium]|nr:DUF2007 domain-containing protein [Geminicoccaceae bacterium]MCB9966634.1 DUF2007 domain-containing protein [Geminicoccaceae bacterium]
MVELVRSNDLVHLSWVDALMREAGIATLVLDEHTSSIEGSIGAIQRRVLVAEDDLPRARRLLAEASGGSGER